MTDFEVNGIASDPLLRLTEAGRAEMLKLMGQGRLPQKILRGADRYFKFLLGRQSRSPLLTDLLNSIFGVLGYPELGPVTLLNTETGPGRAGGRLARIDVRGTDASGRQLIIELQNENHSHFAERSLFYWGRNYIDTLEEGKPFSELKPAVEISLLGFDMFGGEEAAVWDFMMINPRTQRILTGHALLIYVEMKKFAGSLRELRRRIKAPGYSLTGMDRLMLWGGYIGNSETGVELLREAAASDTVFREVIETERRYWDTPEARYLQLCEEMAGHEMATRMEDAEMRGEMRGKLETVRNMLVRGIPLDVVSECSGLSIGEIKDMTQK